MTITVAEAAFTTAFPKKKKRRAIFGKRLKRWPFHGQVTSVVSHSRVFSCATIVLPAWPSCSFEPVCSGCQCVLKIV